VGRLLDLVEPGSDHGHGAVGADPDVVGEIEGGGVHPQRPAQASPRGIEELAEPRNEMRPGLDHVPHHLDPEPTVRIE
jgi:hypothetical protein